MERGQLFRCLVSLLAFLLITSHDNKVLCQENAQRTENSLDEVTNVNMETVVKDNARLLVLFYEPNSPSCEKTKMFLGQYNPPAGFSGDLKIVQSADAKLAERFGITEYPGIIFVRENSPVPYDGNINDEDFSYWLLQAQELATKVLTDDTFEHLTQAVTGSTTGDWLVVFYKDSCSSSLPMFETVAVRLKGKINVAKVNMDESPKIVSRFSLTKCPSTIYFRQGTMYRHEVDQISVKILMSFVQAWYRNMKSEKIPFEPTSFDKATESIALFIKKQLNGPNRTILLGAVGVIIGLTFSILLCCCFRGKSSSKQKTQ